MMTLRRLRLVTQALKLGHRPSTALAADEDTLRQLLAQAKPPTQPAVDGTPIDDDAEAVEIWLEHVERFEGRAFERELRNSWATMGALSFLERRVGPFVRELGRRWASGALGVRHEHFASERLREFLVQRWRPMSDAATGPAMVLATLPGELHVLGLHMAALTLAVGNVRIVFLGADSPPTEIARAVEHHCAEAVALSASASADREELTAQVAALKSALPQRVRVVAGGAGFDPKTPGVDYIAEFEKLSDWLAR